MALALHTENLQSLGHMDATSRPGRDAKDLLTVAPQERVARSRDRSKTNAIALKRFAIEEAELTIPDVAMLIHESWVTTRQGSP